MASRKELKEQRRREREEAERRAARAERRRRRLLVFGGIASVALLGAGGAAVALLGGGEGGPEEAFAAKAEGLDDRATEADLALGADHFHPTVRVVANGETIPIPPDIGVASDGTALVPIHMHPPDETLHAEGVEEGAFSLGQLMTIWGVPFSDTRLGPYVEDDRRQVRVFAKPKGAKAFEPVEDAADLQLRDGDEVYVFYGTPQESPITL